MPAVSSKILIVDDEAHIVELARLYLTREGYEVEGVGDGAQALAELREQTRHSVVQNADERHPVRLLRARRRRRGEERDDERDESHRARDHHAAAGRCSLVMAAIFRQPSILRNLTWPLATSDRRPLTWGRS